MANPNEPACVECGETEAVVGKIDIEGWCGRCPASAELELAREYAADAKRYYNEECPHCPTERELAVRFDDERYGVDPCADRPFDVIDGITGEIIPRDQLED